jgi:o-succinylbenzoate---CoA ligase
MKMQDWLTAQASVQPHKWAISSPEQRSLTYAELNRFVADLCRQLVNAGIQSGDHIAVLLRNTLEYPIVIHALARLGAVLVPINIRLTVSEIEWQLQQADCTAIIHSLQTRDLVEQLRINDLMLIGVGLVRSLENPLYENWAVMQGLITPDAFSIVRTLEPYEVEHDIDLEKPFAIVFTSGTSGKPKGAVLTYGNFFYSAIASAARIGTLPTDRWLCVLPLYHVGGLSIIIRACLYGIEVDLRQYFVPQMLNYGLRDGAITIMSLVPTMLYRLLEEREADLVWSSRLRLILLGGAAPSQELLDRAHALNLPIALTYGLSEACSQVATLFPDDVQLKPGSVGKPLMFTYIRVVNEQGESLPAGEYGEVVVSGPTVMAGYYNQPEATAKILRNGELYTGDIGYLDDEGDLWIVQRRSDLIVSGGENIYPTEVEEVLQSHPAVAAVCVVGVPSVEWGQQVAAAIVLHQGVNVTVNDLMTFSRQRLAGYKQPRIIRFVNALPLTSSGKIIRREVAEMFNQPGTDL